MSTEDSFAENLKRFSATNKEFATEFKKYDPHSLTKDDVKAIYAKLSRHLLNPAYTELVVTHFRKHFLNILLTAIDFNKSSTFDQNTHQRNTVVLAKLIDLHPDAGSFILKYFDRTPAPFETPPATHSQPKRRKTEAAPVEDFQLVDSCYRLLKFRLDFFRMKWKWSGFFIRYAVHPDLMVKWIYIQCLALYGGMNESDLDSFMKKSLSDDRITDCYLKYRLAKGSLELGKFSESGDAPVESHAENVVYGNGIYLPVFDKDKCVDSKQIVEVESSRRNLRRVALGIATNKAVSLLGPVGSGKTSLVEFLAAKTGRVLGESFIKVQLGDQTDSKMLLGTYRCTDIPGEFVWQPGVLTQAVLDGSWLLLEDIDSASMDIASVLSGLIENNYLTVPGYRDYVPITPGFQLFLTQRLISTISGHHKKHTSANTLLEKNVLSINIEPLTPTELLEIISTLHPPLKTICSRMVDVYLTFTRNSENMPRSGRLISTRDLFKWCTRAVLDFDVSSQESALRVLQDAIDIFCCSYPNPNDRLNLSKEISTHLGIINEKARYFCQNYKPHLSLTNSSLKVGRTSMDCTERHTTRAMRFCFTRPSACLLERVMCCINRLEPVLLVGETGTGKTSSVQYLAHTLGQKLIVINMNQQSDSADLLGGYKPVDLKFIIGPIKKDFEQVFASYFKVEPNKKFLSNLNYCFNGKRWVTLMKLMKKSYEAAINRLGDSKSDIRSKWDEIGLKILKLEQQLKYRNALAFAFIEGSLVKAVEKGYWVLLDEINLANAETLECLSGLLEGTTGSISLLERGDKKPVQRHPNFTLFACMNPSTDVGKKDLPAGLRNRFTEFFVEELVDRNDLLLLVNNYLEAMSLGPDKLENIVKFYLKVRKQAVMSLSDGLGHKPHFSLRSLCRALTIASKNPCGMFMRSLYEAFCLSFLTQLDAASYETVKNMIAKYTIGDAKDVKAVLKQPIPQPKSSGVHLQFEQYWILKGDLEPVVMEDYILTQSVRRNLKDLGRVVSIGRLPVLLQGDTSVGKTSLITYLAKSSGYKCVRINNHEHTDLQEYIGSYAANSEGKLEFREGLLVQAMREGHWIILDELNLAPSDVLEALNRVLDDNRELFIPETQEVVKAHPSFMLFATQNPPGAYGGRKMLSRAFRNRFVELHFNEIPHDELEFILHKRCQMAPSYAKKMINVMKDLQMRRRGSAAFAGKHGFITLRDLFRWGERYRLAQNVSSLYDWDQHLADEGYLLLAGRVRKSQEREEIAEAIQKHMKRAVIPANLFTLGEKTSSVTREILENIMANKFKHKNIVWTYNMRQLAVLVCKALQFKEPVLLVGETGGGKTTVCNLIAENNGQSLVTVNCHMHTESSDFLGGLRPVRDHTEENLNKLFEWVDGPLVQAMTKGDLFLADEISLADDSVLERLNSLLEPERTLLLAEKGSEKNDCEFIVAHNNFHFVGTMNPGGDFGKKELSPALRNRFTEIWCESCSNRQDLIDIIEHNLKQGITLHTQMEKSISSIGINIMDFIEWFKLQEIGKRFTISIRDILTWVSFINVCSEKTGTPDAYMHGACLTFLDSLGSGVTSMENPKILAKFRDGCTNFIKNQIKTEVLEEVTAIQKKENQFGITPFFIEVGKAEEEKCEFSFNAPTTVYNALRLLRGLQLNKALLLEGSPGVGKTSLVTALARATKNKIFRVNLSDQTDISDLFGADLPVEGGKAGTFSWRDGPLLQALKRGHWILLDELNLASQSVLEGLNACLDHRGEIFIPELGKTFQVKPGTRFFGCQNPLKQGGSRRGLPQSFLNRFTQVYLTGLGDKDLSHILSVQFPKLPEEVLNKMIKFSAELNSQLDSHTFAHKGAPWEFNLRDLTRWCEATVYHYECGGGYRPENLVKLVFVDRMRTGDDKDRIGQIFVDVFGVKIGGNAPLCYVNKDEVVFGDAKLLRDTEGCNVNVLKQEGGCLILRQQMHVLRSLTYCVNLNWMAILVGTAGSGKSSVVRTMAKLSGKTLKTLSVTSAMDTTDILGGFEQADYTRHLEDLVKRVESLLLVITQDLFMMKQRDTAIEYLQRWEGFILQFRSDKNTNTMEEETKNFLQKLSNLTELLTKIEQNDRLGESSRKDVSSLIEKAKFIKEKVSEEDSLNAGGKFEWVDSVLIKCLQDGSWLLVDNVNLCSPAVLDRLNALLEPNGVLTIGERGVDENGKMVEIKPHPEFRLFLTMDPKNGEISRAMRNRGVEIYILNSEESQKRSILDLEALVDQQGLRQKSHISSLIEVHDYICDITIGEKPNVGELLQAAFLISQQLLRGTSAQRAFTDVILDVYCATKSSSEYNTVNAKHDITEKIEQTLDLQARQNHPYINSCTTINTLDLQTNSQLALIEQQMLRFEQEFKSSSRKYSDLNKFLLMHYLTISAGSDLDLREKYHNLVLGDVKYQNVTSSLIHTLKNCGGNAEYPLDSRWLPDMLNKTDPHVSNRMLLFIYYSLQVKLRDLEETKMKGKVFTLQQYLEGVRKKEVEGKIDDPVIKNILQLLQRYDDFVLNLKPQHLSNEATIETICHIQFRLLLSKFLKFRLTGLSQIDDNVLNNLHVYYKWFVKFSVNSIQRLLGQQDQDLHDLIDSINGNLLHHFSTLRKIGKHYQKSIVKPPPLINITQIRVIPKLHELLEKLDPYSRKNSLRKILSNSETRALAINHKAGLDYELATVPDDLEQFLQMEISPGVPIKDSDLQILPLLDYFCLLKLINFRRNRSDHIVNDLRNHPTVPIPLVSILLKYSSSKDKRLLHELNTELQYYLRNCSALTPDRFIRLGSEAELGQALALQNPVLSYLTSSLLLDASKNNGMVGINLGNHRNVLKMNRDVHTLLFNNLFGVSSLEFNFILCEIDYLKQSTRKFLTTFAASLSIASRDDDGLVLNILEAIGDLYANCKFTDKSNDLQTLTQLITQISEHVSSLTEDLSESEAINRISDTYIVLNYTKALLNSKLPFIDALRKVSMKKAQCLEEKEHLECLRKSFVMQNEVYSDTDASLSPLVGILGSRVEELNLKDIELGKYVAVRPTDVEYTAIVKVVTHGFSTVLSPLKVQQIHDNINKSITLLQTSLDQKSSVDTKLAEAASRLTASTVSSYDNFIENLRTYRYTYPDVIEPLMSNLMELSYGFNMKVSLLKKLIQQNENMKLRVDLDEDLLGFIKLPVLDESRNDYKKSICSYIGDKTHSFIAKVFEGDEHISSNKENFRLLKCSLMETINLCNVDMQYLKRLDSDLFSLLDKLLRLFVGTWKQQEEEAAAKKIEEESLYKMRTLCADKSEEEIADEEFSKLFPSYHDEDFADLQEKVLDDDDMETSTPTEYSGLISQDDIKFISGYHMKYITAYVNTEWLLPLNRQGYQVDNVKPFLQKCRIFKLLLDKFVGCLSFTFDHKVIASLNVLAAVAENFGDASVIDEASPSSDDYNFYKDSNTSIVKACFTIIEELQERIDELLSEWPDHPTLQAIKSIIERICAFDMTSPVPRFLTGFDILLSKCQEWEQNAHSGVTLSQHSLSISRQMVIWRKLEMSCWKNSLDNCFQRLSESCLKHWFYLYEIMTEYIESKEVNESELISSLQKFISQSNLVECQNRIEMLKVFHCHSTFLPRNKRRDTLISILWNLYQYYVQFVPNVIAKMKTLKAPIEKKLKDFVKIIRWKDISYWALKDTLLKTHKAIHKHMREYENVLRQPASPLFINTTNNEGLIGIHDRPHRTSPKSYHYTLDASLYISKLAMKPVESEGDESFLRKTPKYYKVAKNLCRKVINNSAYPELMKKLDCFITQVITTSKHLQELEVTTSLPKEKQVSQAKSHLQQKQRALADLFKSLSKIGLSFRKGIVEYKQRDVASDFLIKPIDLSVSLSHIPHSRSDDKLLILWDGVEIYYRKSLIRMEILEEAAKNPAKDLGMQNMERCKGFGAHLMLYAQEQKQKLIETSNWLYHLRYYQMVLTDLQDHPRYVHTNKLEKLQTVLKNTLITMQQFKMILSSRPSDSSDITNLPQLTNTFAQDQYEENWNRATRHVKSIRDTVEKSLISLQKIKHRIPSILSETITPKYVHIPNLEQLIQELTKIPKSIHDIKICLGQNPLTESLDWITTEIEVNLDSLTSNDFDAKPVDNFENSIEKFIETILLVIQNIYKKHEGAKPKQQETEFEEYEELSEHHLSELLVQNINEDFEVLAMKSVLRHLKAIVGTVCDVNLSNRADLQKLIGNLLPFLEQAISLYQYFVTQLVSTYRILCKSTSILLNIFIDLVTKGFCIPPELSDEMGESKEGKTSSGMGLGDGEGEKDASDKIETEDQLEDAQPEGQEKQKDEDKDCKEEEKGIEMSEDFDSKLQDVDKKPDEEEENDDGNSDAEEQMGDTEKGADRMDKEVWSSSETEDEEEAGEDEGEGKNEEKGNEGEKEGESEMAAKDGESAPQEEEQPGDKEKEQQKKDINELEEPELDDEQTDPYHGNQPELPEPELMDLPDDMQLDDGDQDEEQSEENPFDIDAMKDQMPPPEDKPDDEEKPTEEQKEDEAGESDDEEGEESKAPEVPEIEPEEGDDKAKEEDKVDTGEKEEDKNQEESEVSGMDETQTSEENVQSTETEATASADNVETTATQQENASPNDQVQQEDNPDKEGVGQSQMEDSKTGHKGQANAQQDSQNQQQPDNMNLKRKPGEADTDRSLGDTSEQIKKKLKTVKADDNQESSDKQEGEREDNSTAEIYQHIKEAKEKSEQVLDTITKEQAENLKTKEVPSLEEEEDDKEDPMESQSDLPEEEKPEDIEMVDVNKQKADRLEQEKKSKENVQRHPEGDIEDMKDVEIEGDLVATHSAPRSSETTHHTQFNQLSDVAVARLSTKDMNDLRVDVERQLSAWNEPPTNLEADQTWEKISSLVSSLAQDLSEQLRLVLEPTQASRLKGDFRTGRRINMRKVIPYIASDFRKDKIWMRRTKPSKREYQIVLAIDDSSSMADNHSKELAFESVALISKALTLLESGQLSVLSFGEGTEVLHKLTDPFTEKSGSKLLQKFQFGQKKTCIAKLVDFATEMLNAAPATTSLLAKLLIVVSDGRGIFSEGESFVLEAVRRASLSNIFMIFVIVDSPNNASSILDIRMPIFLDGKIKEIKSYMDAFPFPFYIILRDINSLPNVLSDALRQWFEIVSNIDH